VNEFDWENGGVLLKDGDEANELDSDNGAVLRTIADRPYELECVIFSVVFNAIDGRCEFERSSEAVFVTHNDVINELEHEKDSV
jgi:hypothetical protein